MAGTRTAAAAATFLACTLACAARADGQVGGLIEGPAPPRDRAPVTTGTAAIKGRVVDGATGQPLVSARVWLDGLPGADQPTARTGRDGEFAFAGLPPGRYRARAERSGYLADSPRATLRSMSGGGTRVADGQTVEGVRVELWRAGAIVGRIVDALGEPVEHASVRAVRLPKSGRRDGPRQFETAASSNDLGEFRLARLPRGAYLLHVNAHGSIDSQRAFAPTYYPGVAAAEDAQPIALALGETASVELTLGEVATTRVSGKAFAADGRSVDGGHVSAAAIAPGSEASWSHGGSSLQPDGSFTLRLAPGTYKLEAAGRSFGGGQASATVTVGDQEITGIELRQAPPASVSGRFVFHGTAPPPPLARAGVSLFSPGPKARCGFRQPPQLQPDWTFTALGVSGTCVVDGSVSGAWMVKAVIQQGVDVTGRALDFAAGGSVRDLEVIFTDRLTELSFEVVDERGQPTQQFVAVVFPADRDRWGETRGRHVRTYVPPSRPAAPAAGRPSGGGAAAGASGQPGGAIPGSASARFRQMSRLVPADYFAVAVDDVAVEDLADPDFFEELSKAATRVTLREGDVRTLRLRRLPAPRAAAP